MSLQQEATKYRIQTLGEEIANSVSHGVATLGAIAVTPVLIINATSSGAAAIVGASVFGGTMIVLYLASTLYHAFPHSRTKRVFNILDHAAIFLLIAGTYTPFTLGVLWGAWGWSLFGIVWTLAILGIVIKSVAGAVSGKLSTSLYLAMGWIAIVAAKPFWENIPTPGLIWLLAGGLMYSAGVLFFIAHRMRYGHFIWHLFVMAGTACHVVAVMKYAN
ncbi:MAG TPA: hemolysin III family protein [Cyclobacteriaceae bacterium]|jgi:hemolysin III|nr:hemolysin III family protein [Cyclobacteriaceae bacterium]